MKRILAIVLCVFMFVGCSAINQFLCSPTASQTQAANVGLTLAQAALVATASFAGGSAIAAALSSQAIPVFQKVVQGYCAIQADWDKAVNALAQAQATTTKAITPSPAIQMLQAVKWSR